MHAEDSHDWAALAAKIKEWGKQLGFAAIGFAPAEAAPSVAKRAEAGLETWLAAGYHGEMDYMARHGLKRARPHELLPGTRTVITARMNYQPEASSSAMAANLANSNLAYISRYALGRDYHKLLRNRLQTLAEKISAEAGLGSHRAFTDSAPVQEVALAVNSGLGWRGKHTLLLSRDAGSYFFLGEIYTDLPLYQNLPPTPAATSHCGNCRACLDVCPTQAFVAPYVLDARRCISYLTIELKGSIPLELRPLIGNRVYGCDDCQLTCPWNRFAPRTKEDDFAVRNGLDQAQLVDLFAWSEEDFNQRLAGSAIRRIGHERWLRNLAVGLGNLPPTVDQSAAILALQARVEHPSELVREHVAWALVRLVGNK